ncbi:sigma-70 family RNA polymerase sigma factor [Antrihabitans sp. YC2-6]|uniref:sigma-70 family RNA polymerase sigma factor n=1 Tax=Antrihabitans sp. YC2-6 TaxID=2799498 RepID=UPI0018F481B0|nr:sigma-70 family RNA polymerase sigma factor [Antrihabitans sp. YC2-6]MBJ8343506.1 sigma-70 family RNA polymerase sigma factor [Antrihabitans sp. YC2-6]
MTTATAFSARLRLVADNERCAPHCARLCTDDGMAAAMRSERGLLQWRGMNSLGDSGLAEHSVQETFLRGWKACAKFDENTGSLRAWLLAIHRNLVIDMARSRAVRPGDNHWDAIDDVVGQNISMADFSEALAESWFIGELLERLPLSQREAVAAIVVADRPYQEVAQELGVPVGTLKSRVHYGLRALRGHLQAA